MESITICRGAHLTIGAIERVLFASNSGMQGIDDIDLAKVMGVLADSVWLGRELLLLPASRLTNHLFCLSALDLTPSFEDLVILVVFRLTVVLLMLLLPTSFLVRVLAAGGVVFSIFNNRNGVLEGLVLVLMLHLFLNVSHRNT